VEAHAGGRLMQRPSLWRWLVFAAACALLQAARADDTPIWRGHFLVGRAGAQFNPCRTGDRFALEDATPGRALEGAYRALAQRPGRAIFAEFAGRRTAQGITATRFERALTDGPGCREALQDVRLRAYGFNPFIQVEVRASAVLLRLRPASPPAEYAGAALRVDGGEARLEAASAASVLHLRVRAKPCRETLSNGLFSYEVTVDVGGVLYAACAYWGDLGPIPDLPR
jgi:uncharacterized membrane protein